MFARERASNRACPCVHVNVNSYRACCNIGPLVIQTSDNDAVTPVGPFVKRINLMKCSRGYQGNGKISENSTRPSNLHPHDDLCVQTALFLSLRPFYQSKNGIQTTTRCDSRTTPSTRATTTAIVLFLLVRGITTTRMWRTAAVPWLRWVSGLWRVVSHCGRAGEESSVS